jgi:hypothetical protein
MRIELLKATAEGRDMQGRAIYPLGSWTVWKDGQFYGWNWDWQRLWSWLWNDARNEFCSSVAKR